MESLLEETRKQYPPKLPKIIQNAVTFQLKDKIHISDPKIDAVFTHCKENRIAYCEPKQSENPVLQHIGVLFSGGQASGGHNVISGIFDTMRRNNPHAILYGFIGGPIGLIKNQHRILTEKDINAFRNTGGFDLIGSGRTKIETPAQFESACQTCQNLLLDALIIIGGDDSNTNAALLAEYFLSKDLSTSVLGIPKTIDGDLKNQWIEMSFGFDTATKTYSELIANIARDASSSRKYWHFIKVMGRSASHIALECALQTHPNVCLISEEIAEKKLSLQDIIQLIVDVIIRRKQDGNPFGIVLLPEGLIEFIPEMSNLIINLNSLLAEGRKPVQNYLPPPSKKLFSSLPHSIQEQLLIDRDSHGNVQVSRIETEKLLADMVKEELLKRKESITIMTHFFGYEGRSGYPTNFDADYCYTLGCTVTALAREKLTGYIAAVKHLSLPCEQWVPIGIPLRVMIHLEKRENRMKPVIKKSLVNLSINPFTTFAKQRKEWTRKTSYRYPGPIQFFGPEELTEKRSFTIKLQEKKK